MNKWFWSGMAVCLLGSLACVVGPPSQSPWVEPASGAWATVIPPNAGLTVQMPVLPAIETNVGREPDGSTVRMTEGKLLWGPAAFLGFGVYQNEWGLSGSSDQILDEVSRAVLESADEGTIRSRRDYGYHGFPARELVVENETTVLFGRFYAGRDRVYATYAVIPRHVEQQLTGQVSRYLDSTQLDTADAPEPSGTGALTFDHWTWTYPSSGLFGCNVPGAPRRSQVELRLGRDSHPTTMYEVAAPSGPRYAVHVTFFGERPPTGVLDTISELVASGGYEVRSSSASSLQGYAGREVVFESATEILQSRFFVTNARLYEVRVSMPRQAESSLAASTARFFGSFRIL